MSHESDRGLFPSWPRAGGRKAPVDIDHVARIDAITRNARTTWFALLAALVFVGVTLLSVTHIDFWGVGRATQLPLVNVSVPTREFFGAAPVLTAAIYCYFHIYLIRLWEALGNADPQIDGQFLGLKVTPWLVSDAALYLRRVFRKETPACLPRRALDLPAALLNFGIAWGFGLVVLWFTWRLSFPARSPMLSSFGAVSLTVAAAVGFNSLVVLWQRMRGRNGSVGHGLQVLGAFVFAGLVAGALYDTQRKTNGAIADLAPLSLVDAEIVTRPDNWAEREFARKDFLAIWCRREGIEECSTLGDREREFDTEWTARRSVAITDLEKPPINGVKIVDIDEAVQAAIEAETARAREAGEIQQWQSVPVETRRDLARAVVAPTRLRAANLTDADLRGAFLSGIDLSAARLSDARLNGTRLEEAKLFGADLQSAEMVGAFLEAADLRWATLTDANLRFAEMQGANLRAAEMQGADLYGAEMQGADLSGAEMQGAELRFAEMQGANLYGAEMQGADLIGAEMQAADLRNAKMHSAELRWAKMQGADLGGAEMRGADLIGAEMQGADLREAEMRGADLSGAEMQGAELRWAEMQGANLTQAEMQGAELFRAEMQGAELRWAEMQGANLTQAEMQGANLSFSLLTGTANAPNLLQSTNLSASINHGGALRFVDLTQADLTLAEWRNSFIVFSGEIPEALYLRMDQPCQWTNEALTEEDFFGRWRWWLDLRYPGGWGLLSPEGWDDVPVNPGPEGCTWNEDPFFLEDRMGP